MVAVVERRRPVCGKLAEVPLAGHKPVIHRRMGGEGYGSSLQTYQSLLGQVPAKFIPELVNRVGY